MSLTVRRVIFFSLFAAFLCCSFLVYTSGTSAGVVISPVAKEGRTVFRNYNCIACHQLYGLGGYMGPDLTNVISEKGTPYVRTFIENGTSKMPDFNLSEQEENALIEYLVYVDSTSDYPQRNISRTWYGTLEIKP